MRALAKVVLFWSAWRILQRSCESLVYGFSSPPPLSKKNSAWKSKCLLLRRWNLRKKYRETDIIVIHLESILHFLPQSWKSKMGPSNSNFPSCIASFHMAISTQTVPMATIQLIERATISSIPLKGMICSLSPKPFIQKLWLHKNLTCSVWFSLNDFHSPQSRTRSENLKLKMAQCPVITSEVRDQSRGLYISTWCFPLQT